MIRRMLDAATPEQLAHERGICPSAKPDPLMAVHDTELRGHGTEERLNPDSARPNQRAIDVK
jgi:hypothetical protein